MRRFRTLIITRKKIHRASAALMGIAAAVGICVAIKHSGEEAVAVFSSIDNDISRSILDEGIPKEDEPFDIKSIISGLLGFDTDSPESIIESSSELFRAPKATAKPQESEAAPTPPEAEIAKTEQDTKYQSPSLPSHEEIISAKDLKINNATNYSVDIASLAAAPLETVVTLSNEPEVLIMHTHTTECYIGDEMSGESERTTNESYNVCAVGDVLCQTLEEYGIHTVHDKTIHDYPSYQGSYTRALNTITADLEKYPSVKVVLDLHRDAYVYEDGSKLRVSTKINGADSAQVMLVLGTDSMGLYHPYWQSNLALAAKIQSAADIMYPDLMRSIDLRRERFNMHASKGSLLMEIGSNGNTLSEAKAAARYVGQALAAALLNG